MFKKKTKLTQNLVYMSVMAAINAALSLLSCINGLSGFFSAFVIILLPVISALVTIFCQKKYYPLYFVATFAVCFLSTFFLDPTFSLFAVFPSLITGFLFGLLLEKNYDPIFPLLYCALIQFLLNIATIPLINFITKTDLTQIFINILALTEKGDLGYQILPSFILLISFIEMTFTFIVISKCLEKLGIAKEQKIKMHPWVFNGNFLILILGVLIFSILKNFMISLIFFFLSIFMTFYYFTILLDSKNKVAFIIYFLNLLIAIILFIALYKIVPQPYGLLIITTWPDLVFLQKIITDIYSILKKKNI